jgi:lambda repressor-like predicted transcriptional regulator
MENKFSEWLLNELNKRKWTQKELARKSGLSTSTIFYIITHRYGLGLKSVTCIYPIEAPDRRRAW